MRLMLYALSCVVAVALLAGALAWFAERRLDRAAEAKSFSEVGKVPAVDVALVLGTAPIGPEGGPNRYFVYRLDAAAALYKAARRNTSSSAARAQAATTSRRRCAPA